MSSCNQSSSALHMNVSSGMKFAADLLRCCRISHREASIGQSSADWHSSQIFTVVAQPALPVCVPSVLPFKVCQTAVPADVSCFHKKQLAAMQDEVLIAGFGRRGHAVGDIPGVRFKVSIA